MSKDKIIYFRKSDDIKLEDEKIKKYIDTRNVKIELEPLFKINKISNNSIWKIGYEIKQNLVYTEWGIEGGKMQTSGHNPIPKGKKTEFEQALQYMLEEYEKKIRSGYSVIDDDNQDDPKKQPMLANKYFASPSLYKTSSHVLAKKQIQFLNKVKPTKIELPVMISAKLDGMRVLVRREKNKIIYKSRTNIELEHLNVFDNHFNIFFKYFPDGYYLDGEMYGFDEYENHVDFQEIISTLKKEKDRTEEDNLKLYNMMKFCIFDSDIEGPFEYRFSEILRYYKKYISDDEYKEYNDDKIVILNNIYIDDEKDIIKFQDSVIDQGFEGTMIRKLYYSKYGNKKWFNESYYNYARSNMLLKFKYFEDEEGTIISIHGGKKGSKDEDCAIFLIKNDDDIKVTVVPASTKKERKKMLLNKKDYIGRRYTYKFFGKTKDGVPKIATGFRFRDD